MKKMQHCWFCGKELGVYDKSPHERDTCGDRECNREAQYAYQAERDEAHQQVDDSFGW